MTDQEPSAPDRASHRPLRVPIASTICLAALIGRAETGDRRR